MAKEQEKLEGQEPVAEVSLTPNRDKMLENLRGKYGADKSDEDLFDLAMKGYDADHEAV